MQLVGASTASVFQAALTAVRAAGALRSAQDANNAAGEAIPADDAAVGRAGTLTLNLTQTQR